jgi:RNase adapter protein RapZ
VDDEAGGALGDESPELIIITGLAGAGRETAAHALEDLGWYVVDNLPPRLIPPLVDQVLEDDEMGTRRLAVQIDARSGTFFSDLPAVVEELARREIRSRVVFLTADDATLVKRFDAARRPHPLQGEGGLLDGIRREREMLAPLKKTADLTINTSALNVHQLTMRMRSTFGSVEDQRLRVNVVSFGFKYGLPAEADHVSDVRFLPNPYWIPELKPLRGTDAAVSEFVLSQPNAGPFVDAYLDMIKPVLAGYREENKHFATLAIGCTGGKHRSVALAEEIGRRLRQDGVAARVRHRDLGRE